MWWAVVAGMLISRRWIVLGFQARAGVEVGVSSWEKAGRLQVRVTFRLQIWFCAMPCRGKWLSLVSFAQSMRFPGSGLVVGGGP